MLRLQKRKNITQLVGFIKMFPIKSLHLVYSDFPFHYRLLICSVTSFYFSFNATTKENLENYIPRSTIKLANPRGFQKWIFSHISNSIVSLFSLSISCRHVLLHLLLSVILPYPLKVSVHN